MLPGFLCVTTEAFIFQKLFRVYFLLVLSFEIAVIE